MIGTCDQSNEFLLVHVSASMFKLSVIEVRIVRLEHVSIDFAAAWSYSIVCAPPALTLGVNTNLVVFTPKS